MSSVSSGHSDDLQRNSDPVTSAAASELQAYECVILSPPEAAAGHDYGVYEETQRTKRKRGDNWNDEDELLLVQLYQNHYKTSSSDRVTVQVNSTTWRSLANQFNSLTNCCKRDAKALKSKLKAIKMSAKKKVLELKQCSTEGSRWRLRLTAAEHLLARLYSDLPEFSEVTSSLEANSSATNVPFETIETYIEGIDPNDTEQQYGPQFVQHQQASTPVDCGTVKQCPSTNNSKVLLKSDEVRSKTLKQTVKVLTQSRNFASSRSLAGAASSTPALPAEKSHVLSKLQTSVVTYSRPSLIPVTSSATEQSDCSQLQRQVLLKQLALLTKQDALLDKQMEVADFQLQYYRRKLSKFSDA